MIKPLVSVLVLSFNERHRLDSFKKSLEKLEGNFSLEVILADNGSTDGTVQWASKNGWKVSGNAGKNIGTPIYNYALAKASGEFIFFIQNDMAFEGDCLQKLLDEMHEHPKTAHACPKLLDYFDHSKVDVAGSWLSRSFYGGSIKDHSLNRAEIPFYGTGLLRASALKAAGGYIYHPDYFLYGEDVDLGLRLWASGFKVVFVPGAIVYHMGAQSEKLFKKPFLTYLVERNQLRNLLKNLEAKNVLLLLPYALSMRIFSIAKDILHFDFARALCRVRAIGWIALNFPAVLRERKQNKALRKVPDSSFMHIFTEKYFLKVVSNVFYRRALK